MGKWHKLMLTCLLSDVTAAPEYIFWRVKKKVAQGKVGLPSQKRSSCTVLRLLLSYKGAVERAGHDIRMENN
jgi:hypothetical protein